MLIYHITVTYSLSTYSVPGIIGTYSLFLILKSTAYEKTLSAANGKLQIKAFCSYFSDSRWQLA